MRKLDIHYKLRIAQGAVIILVGLLILTAVTSCIIVMEHCECREIEPKLGLVLDDFINEADARNVHIQLPNYFRLRFTDMHLARPGRSHKKNICGGWADVTINDRFMKRDPDDMKLKLVTFHELAHALLDKDHVNDSLDIMHPSVDVTEETFPRHSELMLNKLFDSDN